MFKNVAAKELDANLRLLGFGSSFVGLQLVLVDFELDSVLLNFFTELL